MDDWDSVSNETSPNSTTDAWDTVSTPQPLQQRQSAASDNLISDSTPDPLATQQDAMVAAARTSLPSVPITRGFLPARMRLPTRRAIILALLVLVVVGSGGIWVALYEITHRSPSTPSATAQNIFQMAAVVGHNDSAINPSIFFAFNLYEQATTIELSGGVFVQSRVYVGPLLSGSDVSVTLRFQKVTGNSLPDMIVYGGQNIKVFENNGEFFLPAPSNQVPQNKLPGPTSSNANYPLSWASAVVGHSDSTVHPSGFFAANIRGQIAVYEFFGGDPSKAIAYGGPDLSGSGEDQSVPTLSFGDRNHDGKVDMIVNVVGQQFVFYNNGTRFIPPPNLVDK